MTQADNRKVVQDFFVALGTGDLPDALFTDDMTAWTASSGAAQKALFQQGIKFLQSLFPEKLKYTVEQLTVEDDRVVAEARSRGTFADGDVFENTYAFVFRIRDGRIASMREHGNTMAVREKIIPRLQAAMAKK